jgi:hypothetical protein
MKSLGRRIPSVGLHPDRLQGGGIQDRLEAHAEQSVMQRPPQLGRRHVRHLFRHERAVVAQGLLDGGECALFDRQNRGSLVIGAAQQQQGGGQAGDFINHARQRVEALRIHARGHEHVGAELFRPEHPRQCRFKRWQHVHRGPEPFGRRRRLTLQGRVRRHKKQACGQFIMARRRNSKGAACRDAGEEARHQTTRGYARAIKLED